MAFLAPVPPDEVRRRLERAFTGSGRGRPIRCRVRPSGLLKVGPVSVLPVLDDRPQAYVAVLPDGDGAAKVNGVVRAGWLARFVWAWIVLVLPATLSNVVFRTRAALDGGGAGAWFQAVLAVVVTYSFFELLVANRRGKAALRDRLADTVTGAE